MSIVLGDMMTNKRVRRFLSAWRRPLTLAGSHLHVADGVRLARRMGAAQVLSRALCRFRYLPFHDLAKRDRLGFVQVQLLTWAPFPESEFALVMGDRGAVVFAWDQAAFRERSENAGIPALPDRLIPETMLHCAIQEGVTLRRCVEGVEGQVWRDGVLKASRWWAQTPDLEGWLNFQRGASVLPEDQIAEPPVLSDAAEWSPVLWAEPQKLSDLMGRARRYEQMALALASLLLALPTLWLLKCLLVEEGHLVALTKEKQRLEEKAQPVMQARGEALEALMTLEAIVKRVDHPNPLVLLAHLSQQLPKDGNILRELEWEGSRVRLKLLPPPLVSRIVYVEALEGGGWLCNVREQATEGENPGEGVVLVADLKGNAPSAAGGGDTNPAAPPAVVPSDSSQGEEGTSLPLNPAPPADKGAGS